MTDSIRDAFLKCEKALRPLSDEDKHRVLKAFAILLEYPADGNPEN